MNQIIDAMASQSPFLNILSSTKIKRSKSTFPRLTPKRRVRERERERERDLEVRIKAKTSNKTLIETKRGDEGRKKGNCLL